MITAAEAKSATAATQTPFITLDKIEEHVKSHASLGHTEAIISKLWHQFSDDVLNELTKLGYEVIDAEKAVSIKW